MALSNFHKALRASSRGMASSSSARGCPGTANLIVAPIFGVMLVVYVYGIFAMRKFALPLGIFYAAYVILNMPLFI